ncbi:cysteine desulfurase family protein, partial [Rubrivirga sp.]|uniref:cysteine desulfurase family protein n=1 Tax=Rubrivirga sp. TaxID=1885344 RepID=UPI003C73CB72
MSAPVYLDYNATTPTDERVLEAMLPFFREHFGNPHSEHAYGWTADEAVKKAREQTAKVIGATPRTMVFTSGATESISLAIRGAGAIYGGKRHRIVTVQTEHKAVLETCQAMEREGYETTYLPVDENGLVDPDAVEEAVDDQTFLVSVMWANNETGVIQPIPEIAERAHAAGAIMMSDATQAVGRVPTSVNHDGVDLLAMSGHKMYGPKGIGALYVRQRGPRVKLQPQATGGSQEAGHRAGTLNVPGVVGMGMASHIARRSQASDAERQSVLRDRLEAGVLEA